VAAAADQRNLKTKSSIADMATELENDRRENVRKLSQAHDVSARTVYAALMRMAKLSKKVGEKTVFLGDEEGAIQDV
jgi:hypothetical protein